tara:strand:- start:1055 stop:2632 length:1578 start_codon:yes stop_codon:yes gene_type:complete
LILSKPNLNIEVIDNGVDSSILTPCVLRFLSLLNAEFNPARVVLLGERKKMQADWDTGILPDFLDDTSQMRDTSWSVAPASPGLTKRHVEITGPPERKMIINALNSGANVFMADFEDSTSPTWENIISGQVNLHDAILRTIEYNHPTKGTYILDDDIATLMVRPRGLHLDEKHVVIDGIPMSASLFDFGVFMFLNATRQISNGLGPYFYLPKLEHHLEAKWWNDVFVWVQNFLKIPIGTIRATVLLETLPAAFQMEEILYQLRQHSAGLNCGRWDYIFSYIKTFRNDSSRILPDRDSITMIRHFMSSYTTLVISTCHRRGAYAMGGMAAQIPIRNNEEANDMAMRKVHEDKLREVMAGHDGTWVAHPGLVGIAKDAFTAAGVGDNQLSIIPDTKWCTQRDLLEVCMGDITRQGLNKNIEIGITYLASWLSGNGCVPLYNLMEDAATAEISRAQLWQWCKHEATLKTGEKVNKNMLVSSIGEITQQIKEKNLINSDNLSLASSIFKELCLSDTLADFLTLPAYDKI